MNSVRIGRSGIAQLQSQARTENDLLTWAIFDHPEDFPDAYVVRPSSMKLGCALTVHFQHAQLEHERPTVPPGDLGMSDPHEFDCVECGRHIWRAIPLMEGETKLCAECTMIPGWIDDPELRKRLDPTGDVDPAKIL